jgi:hypothetical protein
MLLLLVQVWPDRYPTLPRTFRTVWANEGFRAFYASYPVTVAMNVPFMAVYFAAYESFKVSTLTCQIFFFIFFPFF